MDKKTAVGRTASSGLGSLGSVHQRGYERYRLVFATLFSLSVFFSLTDLLSTAVALRAGLAESNSVIIALGNYLGVGILGALGLTKVAFIGGSLWAALYGSRTTDLGMKKRAVLVLASLVVLLCAVCLNNIYLIVTSA